MNNPCNWCGELVDLVYGGTCITSSLYDVENGAPCVRYYHVDPRNCYQEENDANNKTLL